MKTFLILVSLLFLNFFSSAQNWFPLEVGNISRSRYEYYYMGARMVEYYCIKVTADTIFNGQKYYFVKNYRENSLNESFWLRYDQGSQIIYQFGNDTSVVYMDFNLPNGSQFVYNDPITGVSTTRTVIESTATHFGIVRYTKGFVEGAWWKLNTWINEVGSKPFGPLIQVLQFKDSDTTYFDYGYAPDFRFFEPTLKTNKFIFTDTVLVDHKYSNHSGPHPQDFIDYLLLTTFYKSDFDSIPGQSIYSTYCPGWGQKITFQLDQNLIKQGYEFYYNVTAKDKGLIPKYRTKPTNGYYKLVVNPSPAQILFSEDGICVPTLSDSGSVKIINTSDYSVRIDSIISVGSFFGYWGNFTKPGFEYPFYLFQTMPGFMGDTLGIIIPPYDSITVSFFNVDLCPICDYEVQEYFEDTLRFVFTFLDGNVYSFSKSIPISGEGYPSVVEDDKFLPKEFSLLQNYPNPFNPTTTVSWQSPVSGWQTIKIFNTLGQEVETIVNDYLEAGFHSKLYIVNSALPSGVYYYQLRAGNHIETRKMIYLK